jgi:hypothetical protein
MKPPSKSVFSVLILIAVSLMLWLASGPVQATESPSSLSCTISSPHKNSVLPSPVRFVAKVRGGVAPYTYKWTLRRGSPDHLTKKTSSKKTAVRVSYAPGNYRVVLKVTDSAANPVTVRTSVKIKVALQSINSTSDNLAGRLKTVAGENRLVQRTNFQLVAANDLGMHCGDLDHRMASVLPPFNVIHTQVIMKGATPQILTGADVDVFYAAASNPRDPAIKRSRPTTIFKTNFWDLNPRGTGHTLAFDGYDPFYPPGILAKFPLSVDFGLPAPDLERLYLGDGVLTADQQSMPGAPAPYAVNDRQKIARYYADLPFFINFPFGYTLNGVNWFAGEGIPIAPFDDQGRKNSYPLMRVQATDKTGGLTGKPGKILASLDTVLPVSAEADCFRCHTSAVDGGNGQAACIPGFDALCTTEGSLRSSTRFTVAKFSDDTAGVPVAVSLEWAADINIIRLHDAKHGTALEATSPVVCQRCHYTPALDLAHVGPLGPGDPDANGKLGANGREQLIHATNSRVLHTFHAALPDLFQNDLPPANDSRRIDPTTGKPVVNAFVQEILNNSCYQCHPGRDTRCLRGAMVNGGLVCQDCHGGMQQVGNDFSQNFSLATPFGTTGSTDLTKRVPWANEPGCQSCHSGDALDNLGLTDPNVIRSGDGIRLLRAYRTTDTLTAKPIVATNRRFAENQTAGGTQVLYRLSKDTHAGLFCEACHGSTHAEWPVKPDHGTFVANDNQTPNQLQGHTGKVMECSACHTAGSPSLSLDGPHGMHPVGDQRWVDGHENFLERNSSDSCRTCHGTTGLGTVLAKVSINRSLTAEDKGKVNLAKGSQVTCNRCHGNKLGGGGGGGRGGGGGD